MQFPATIRASGKNTTGIPVPSDIVEALGAGKRPPVQVTINGYTYRTTIASMGGEFMISVSADVREKACVKAGDEVDVGLALDTSPREVEMPPDFLNTLMSAPEAKDFFDGLSYSNKRRIQLSIEGAKTEDTRQRRISKAMENLRLGKV